MENEINIVCDADDIALIADIQISYNSHLSCLKFNMKTSTHKTKAMTISKDPTHCKIVNLLQEGGIKLFKCKHCSLGNLVKELKTSSKTARVTSFSSIYYIS